MDKYFGPFQLTQGGRPQFEKDEVELQLEQSLSIYFGDQKKLRKGQCTLTTHHILWTDGDQRQSFHLKHIKAVDTKSGFIGLSSPKITIHLDDLEVVEKIKVDEKNMYQMIQQNQVPKIEKIPPPHPGYIMLSFHNGNGRDEFLKKLNKAIEHKAWKIIEQEEKKRQFSVQNAGISGIMKQAKLRSEKNKEVMNEAFQDLETLMINAKEMVQIANQIAQSQESKDDAEEYDNMLQNLGIASPVTKETAGSQYHSLLARQLSDFLFQPLQKNGGIMNLIDVYCLFNRARGSELVSPDDLLQACKYMIHLKLPMSLKQFKTGVTVVQLNSQNEHDISKYIIDIIKKYGGIDELSLSKIMNISIQLAQQHLESAEQLEYLCRDESVEGVKFHQNFFKMYEQQYNIN